MLHLLYYIHLDFYQCHLEGIRISKATVDMSNFTSHRLLSYGYVDGVQEKPFWEAISRDKKYSCAWGWSDGRRNCTGMNMCCIIEDYSQYYLQLHHSSCLTIAHHTSTV